MAKSGNANLLIGGSRLANREIGVPRLTTAPSFNLAVT